MKDTIPEWFDKSLLDIYNKKRDRSLMRKRDRTLDAILRTFLKMVPDELGIINTHKHTWEDIENMIENVCIEVIGSKYAADVVMGIKSGGAFIANYVAHYLGIEGVDYIRVSHYSDKSRSVVRSLTELNKEARVSEKNTVDVSGKKVLLVDDQTATGSSLVAGTNSMLSQGAKEVKTLCLFSKRSGLVDYYAKKGLGVYFPWGKDA